MYIEEQYISTSWHQVLFIMFLWVSYFSLRLYKYIHLSETGKSLGVSHRVAGRKWEAAWHKWKNMDFGINSSWSKFCPLAVHLEQVSLLLWTLQVLHFKNRDDNANVVKGTEYLISGHSFLLRWAFLEHTTLFLLSGLCTPPCIALSLVGFLPSLTLSFYKWYLFWVCFKIRYVSPTSYSVLLCMLCLLYFHSLYFIICFTMNLFTPAVDESFRSAEMVSVFSPLECLA